MKKLPFCKDIKSTGVGIRNKNFVTQLGTSEGLSLTITPYFLSAQYNLECADTNLATVIFPFKCSVEPKLLQ